LLPHRRARAPNGTRYRRGGDCSSVVTGPTTACCAWSAAEPRADAASMWSCGISAGGLGRKAVPGKLVRQGRRVPSARPKLRERWVPPVRPVRQGRLGPPVRRALKVILGPKAHRAIRVPRVPQDLLVSPVRLALRGPRGRPW
jgi:hypothetical protein